MSYYTELIRVRGQHVSDSLLQIYPQMSSAEMDNIVFDKRNSDAFIDQIAHEGALSERDVLIRYGEFINRLLSGNRTPVAHRTPYHTPMGRSVATHGTSVRDITTRITTRSQPGVGRIPARGTTVREISTHAETTDLRSTAPAVEPVIKEVRVYPAEEEPVWVGEEHIINNGSKKLLCGTSYKTTTIADAFTYVEITSGNILSDPKQIVLDLSKAINNDVVAKITLQKIMNTEVSDEQIEEFRTTIASLQKLMRKKLSPEVIIVEHLPTLMNKLRMSEVSTLMTLISPIISKYFKTAYVNGDGGKAYLGGLAAFKNLQRLVPGRCCEDKNIEYDLSMDIYATRFNEMCREIMKLINSISIISDGVKDEANPALLMLSGSDNSEVKASMYNAITSAQLYGATTDIETLVKVVPKETVFIKYADIVYGTTFDPGMEIKEHDGFMMLKQPKNTFGWAMREVMQGVGVVHTLSPGNPILMATLKETLNLFKE